MSPNQIPPLRGRATIITVSVVLVLIILCLLAWMFRDTPPLSRLFGSTQTMQLGAFQTSVSYVCNEGKTIIANYYDGPSSTASNGMPIPGGAVVLTLNDSGTMTLPHAVSADGARYANKDESFVFWSKGNTAFIQEGSTQTYSGCLAQSPRTDAQKGWNGYTSAAFGFSILYPANYMADTAYQYQALGPGKAISGVKFTIPASMATGTNLSSDTYVSVEQLPNTTSCSADMFLDKGAKVSTQTIKGVQYSVGQLGGAGAGNLYDETVYAVSSSMPCTAVRYFIHSTQLANYPAGTRTAFDQAALVAEFDQIRDSLTFAK